MQKATTRVQVGPKLEPELELELEPEPMRTAKHNLELEQELVHQPTERILKRLQ